MAARRSRNPFYMLLIPVGIAFVVTAFAYGFMAFQAVNGSPADVQAHRGHPLFLWLRVHGDAAMLIEIAVLGVLTTAAIATDRWWDSDKPPVDRFTS
jgi:hypothetical protein